MLYDEIIKSGLTHKLIKFIPLALWYAARMDETYFRKWYKGVRPRGWD